MAYFEAPDESVWIGFLRLHLYFPLARSKKDKRKQIHKLRDRFRTRYNLSIAEVGYLENPKRSVLGAVMISNEQSLLYSSLQSRSLEAQSLIDGLIESSDIHIQRPTNQFPPSH